MARTPPLCYISSSPRSARSPWPVVHVDTGFKFPDIYDFRDRLAEEWGFELIVARNPEAQANPFTHSREECCYQRKTLALRRLIEEHGFDAVIVAIRRDEHPIRGKERVVSPRDRDFKWRYDDQPPELIGWGLLFSDFGEKCTT